MNHLKDRLRLVLIAVLLALAGSNLVSGFSWLLSEDGGGGDLNLRWREQQYVLRGKNPFDVYAAWRAEQDRHQEPQLDQSVAIDPDLGLPTPGYPPWAYGTGILFMWSADPMVVRFCFAGVNLVLLGCIAGWNFRLGGARWELALLFPAASLAADSLCATLAVGQLGIIVVGSLLAASWFDERRRPILAGLLLGVALIKPTLSLPFLLPFFIKGRWLTLAVASAYTVLASGIVWALVQTDPITMLVQMQTAALEWKTIYYTGGADPIALLTYIGVPPKVALQVSPVIGLAFAFVLLWFWRRASMMTLFAIASIAARFWVRHLHYDDLIVLFVLFGLAEVLAACPGPSAAVAYGILAFAFVLPRFFHIGLIWDHLTWRLGDEGECLFSLCQLGALTVLLVNSPRNASTPENAATR